MRIISKTNRIKRKNWILAAITGVLMMGVQQPVQAAVTQNDLASPVSDASTHIYTYLVEDEYFEMYHQSTYKYVYFGLYPQSEVTGVKLTDAIRNASYDSNGDATVDGKRYRRIQYSQTGIKTINPSDEFYEKEWVSGSVDGYRYFLYEPIRWRILSNEGSTLLLQTEEGIDTQMFSSYAPKEETFWSGSDLRKWLNYNGGESNLDRIDYPNSKGFYYYAFSDEQKAKIQTTHLVQDSFKEGISGGEDTDDKIFVLSNSELRTAKYGFCNNTQCYVRAAKDTAYASATVGDLGGYTRDSWTRTPYKSRIRTLVSSSNTGDFEKGLKYNQYGVVVRPAAYVSYNVSDCFKVSFVTGTDKNVESQIMIASSVAKEPEEPVKEGYTFIGWYLDKDCQKSYDFTKNLTADTTLYAGWQAPNSKEVVSPQEIKEAEKVTEFKTDQVSYKIDSKMDKTVIFDGFTGDKVTIPSTVEYGGITYKVIAIDANAFKDCKNLTEVTIGKYITEIPAETFTGCTRLKTITFKDGSQLTSIGDNAFSGCKKLTGIKLPSGITSIGSKAFYGCSSLTKIVIRKNITIIKQGAFQNCTKLKTVTFEKGSQLMTLGSKAFYKCNALRSITIPSKVSIIEKQTFYGCSNMTKANIGKNVTAIKQGAFQNCKKLKTITVKTQSLSKSKVGKNAFKSINKKATFKVPKKKYKTYMKIFKQKKIGYKSSMKIKKY